MSTQPIGLQADGAVNLLYPPGLASLPIVSPTDISPQLVVVQGEPPEPGADVSLELGAPDQVSGGYQLDEGWYFLVNEGDPSQAQAFYTDGVTETVPTGGWQAYPVTVTVV